MIGTGWISSAHLEALSKVQDVELVAVAWRDRAKAAERAKPYNAVAYDDWQAMLARERLDGVYVCLAPKLAGEVALGCAGKVRGVMVEKPVTSEVADAQAAAKAFKQAGTIAGAAYHNRTRAVVGRIKELCAQQPPVIAEAYWHGGMPPPLWWRTRSLSGGQMTEQCTHLVDLLRVWMGEANSVTAVAARGTMAKEVEGFDVDDAIAGTIQFKSGAIASVHTSCIAKDKQSIGGVGITLRARGWEAKLTGWGLDAQIRHADGSEETIASEPDAFVRQATAFVAALQSGDVKRLPCTYADAVETLRLTRALDNAAASGTVQSV
jgi:predicted dehydrogenase